MRRHSSIDFIAQGVAFIIAPNPVSELGY